MYTNRATINTTAAANGGSNFVSDYYWSSTESGSYYAWSKGFSSGNQATANKNYATIGACCSSFLVI